MSVNAGGKYEDINHIKTNIVPTNLCSANDKRKEGLSVVTNWNPTILKSNTFTMEFCATAPHVPSFWEIYISNEGFDSTKKSLEWTDVTLFKTF